MLALIQNPNVLENALDSPEGLLALFLACCFLYNAVLWLFFPWIVMSKMSAMTKHLKNIEVAVEAMERNSRPAGAARSESSVKYKMPGPND